jgi:hypothetical protein
MKAYNVPSLIIGLWLQKSYYVVRLKKTTFFALMFDGLIV